MSAKHTFAIAPQAMEILHECTMTDTTVVLPDKQLPRSLYESVNDVLKEFGGIWNRGKKRHDFPIGGIAKLKAAMGTGEVKREKVIRQAFYTPDNVANELALFALLQGRTRPRVLEPSCGDGALIRAIRHVCPSAVIVGVESDKDAIEQARANLGGNGEGAVVLQHLDFLKASLLKNFDVVVMNPPFQRGQATKHIEHALTLLNSKGMLVSIVPSNFLPIFKTCGAEIDCDEQLIPAGSFKESGTMIATKMIRIIKK